MSNLSNIINNYVDSEHRFKKAITVYFREIVDEFNSILPGMKFDIVNMDILTDVNIDVETIIGNSQYKFILVVYLFTKADSMGIYQLVENGTKKNINISLSSSPKEIASLLIQFIDPKDIIKSRNI